LSGAYKTVAKNFAEQTYHCSGGEQKKKHMFRCFYGKPMKKQHGVFESSTIHLRDSVCNPKGKTQQKNHRRRRKPKIRAVEQRKKKGQQWFCKTIFRSSATKRLYLSRRKVLQYMSQQAKTRQQMQQAKPHQLKAEETRAKKWGGTPQPRGAALAPLKKKKQKLEQKKIECLACPARSPKGQPGGVGVSPHRAQTTQF